jgi:hypothetical protein
LIDTMTVMPTARPESDKITTTVSVLIRASFYLLTGTSKFRPKRGKGKVVVQLGFILAAAGVGTDAGSDCGFYSINSVAQT